MALSGTAKAQSGFYYITALSCNPSSVVGGNNSTGTVTISSPAGMGGQSITLTSNNAAASVPASVTVAQGQTSATFTVTTLSVSSLQNCTITASTLSGFGSSFLSCNLAVNPMGGGGGSITITNFTLSPTSVVGGLPVQATVTLSAAAPSGGYAVSLSCSNNAAVGVGSNTPYPIAVTPFPTSVTVQSGQTTLSFYLNTSTVTYSQTFTLTAANVDNSTSLSATLTLLPTNLRVTDYLMPKALKLTWEAQSANGYYTLVRSVMSGSPLTRSQSVIVTTVPSSTTTYSDAYNFTDGTTYLYELFDTTANPPPVGTLITSVTRLSAEMVTPYAQGVQENQTVDSRLDLRYATTVYKDFAFGSRIYRGGLFAGYAPGPDNSQVSRSFAKFQIGAPPANTTLRAGDINLYMTGAKATISNLPLGCQAIANNTWSSPSLVWTLAPLVTPGNATSVQNLSWDKSNPVPQWIGWPLQTDLRNAALQAAANQDSHLSVALAAPNESQSGWVYFAKKEYDATLAPTATHVWAWPVPIKLFVCSTTTMSMGIPTTTWTYTVIVNGLNPGETTDVRLDFEHGGWTVVTVSSLCNTFHGSITGDAAPQIPMYATCNGVMVARIGYPGTSPCDGGNGGGPPPPGPQ